ncbi:hypothetical protein BOTBODRAFT_365172 [Botryobasidium botryosum FD-172 SS1]|uniref:Uncharacterized protein n=1 Tax=Botryobasidium botryosum (strain FD-172 SS1) TaxID=930990 RepID=A0A067MP67_BOTB1|nr:hypothetical protein BOTBODRAFT_365172 [Botryobasidium botryosum FD-172 SS1]
MLTRGLLIIPFIPNLDTCTFHSVYILLPLSSPFPPNIVAFGRFIHFRFILWYNWDLISSLLSFFILEYRVTIRFVGDRRLRSFLFLSFPFIDSYILCSSPSAAFPGIGVRRHPPSFRSPVSRCRWIERGRGRHCDPGLGAPLPSGIRKSPASSPRTVSGTGGTIGHEAGLGSADHTHPQRATYDPFLVAPGAAYAAQIARMGSGGHQ